MNSFEEKIKDLTKNLTENESEVFHNPDNPGFLAIAHKASTEKVNSFFGQPNLTSLFYDIDLKKLFFTMAPINNNTPENTIYADVPINNNIIETLKIIANSNAFLEIYLISYDMKTIRATGAFRDEMAKIVVNRELKKIKDYHNI